MRGLTVFCLLALPLGAMASPPMAPSAESAPETPASLEVGDQAPDFALPKTAGEADDAPATLEDLLASRNVLLAFYPKAFTGGCTKQMCGYRDDFTTLEADGVTVVAVSTDAQKDSDRFKEEYGLPFRVIGDPDKAIVNAYGVSLIGGGAMASRQVFLIAKDGIVRYIDRSYDVAEGRAPLYAAIGKLNEAADAEPGEPAEEEQPSGK